MNQIVAVVVGALLAGVTVFGGTSALSSDGTRATAGQVQYGDE